VDESCFRGSPMQLDRKASLALPKACLSGEDILRLPCAKAEDGCPDLQARQQAGYSRFHPILEDWITKDDKNRFKTRIPQNIAAEYFLHCP